MSMVLYYQDRAVLKTPNATAWQKKKTSLHSIQLEVLQNLNGLSAQMKKKKVQCALCNSVLIALTNINRAGKDV